MKISLGAKPLAFPMPTFLVACYDLKGQANAMTVAWGGVVCGQPPCLGVAINHVRYTYEGIVKNKAFTVNIPKTSQSTEADYLGMYSGKDRDKLARAKFTAIKSQLVNAPYIDDCPVVIECELAHEIDLGSHGLFVGTILDVKANENTLTDGNIDITKVDPLIFSASREYYQIGSFVGKAFSVGKSLK
ncbi:MAG: flavin reductase family protein [Deltaproteobacteria bacterium]|jgi:flavin reductase (DIM6/NTAB) family NADH-FMN oxidoreductase RutF|nr:flavin reductase family protein [Deltaproteobacteria bacterium]